MNGDTHLSTPLLADRIRTGCPDIDMEIYISGTTLFMIMDTEPDFNHEEAMNRLSGMERQTEWEKTVSAFQKTSPDSSAKEKWRLLERIFKMDAKADESAEDGYREGQDISQ